jgi:acyl-CoA reductase-like NAD-dependent aldehyde dehydrogenase
VAKRITALFVTAQHKAKVEDWIRLVSMRCQVIVDGRGFRLQGMKRLNKPDLIRPCHHHYGKHKEEIFGPVPQMVRAVFEETLALASNHPI